jgi:putative toxin-antitoxin system antitoxin component (TIGR02293 family)
MLIFGKIVAMAKAVKVGTKRSDLNTVNESGAVYNLIDHGISLAYWLGISAVHAKKIVSDFDIIKLGTDGLTKNAINNLASFIGISRKQIAENIFDISVKTLERKDNNTRLDKKTSSHAVEIARVLQHTYDVFRDEEKVKRWLNKENRALNNVKPVELFDTLSGLNMVNDILGRIEEGVYS